MTIAARANATPLQMVFPGGTLPAGIAATTVTLQSINGYNTNPLLDGSGGGTTGKLWIDSVPIPGSISRAAPDYKFSRTTAGNAVILNPNKPYAFTYNFADAHIDDIHIIAIGTNGPAHPRPLNDARAMIQRMTALDKRFIIVNRPQSTDSEDAAYHDEFGRRFFSLRKYLVDYGLADAGLTPTAQDTTDIAAGVVPTSLRIDSVHGNAAYYHIWGQQLFNRMVEFGWV